MASLIDIAELSDLYAAGQTLLFPHAYAARAWRSRLQPDPQSGDHLQPPLAWREWTSSLWSWLVVEGHDDRLLLNRLQEEQLWATITGSHSPSAAPTPLALQTLAELSRGALESAAILRLLPGLRRAADTVDAQTFATWLELFFDTCQHDRLLSPSLLDEALSQSQALPAHLPRQLHLVGFDRITPRQQHLLDALARNGVASHQHTLHQSTNPCSRQAVRLPDTRTELRSAVRLIRQHLLAHASSKSRIALVCPNPETHRAALERLFRELLAPELEPVFADLSSVPWQFTQEAPLRSVPMITDALSLLRWTEDPLSVEQLEHLLASPFFTLAPGGGTSPRLESDFFRRVPALRGSVSLRAFLTRLGSRDNRARASFPALDRLAGVLDRSSIRGSVRSAADWSEEIRRRLQAVGWPGTRQLSALEFSTLQAWEGLLDLLATLNFDGSRTTLPAFLHRLQAESARTPCGAVHPDLPVQVLTLAETEALSFDLVLHLEATDRHLPPLQRRHPLLPQRLQRDLGLGDPAVALEQSRAMLASLLQRSTATILLASEAETADGAAQFTPLASDLAFTFVEPASLLAPEAERTPVSAELFHDPAELPISPERKVGGGVAVLQDQAACGFRSFALHRLKARAADSCQLGLNALQSGSVLHKALEFVWGDLLTQDALRTKPDEELQSLIRNSVRSAFTRENLAADLDDPWSQTYLHLLEQRFSRLVRQWLRQELDRLPFRVVTIEDRQDLTLGPLTLKTRTDRIDEVNGKHVLIDYKTSSSLSRAQWLGERPEAPQLPIYALMAAPGTLHDIAFAQVRPGSTMRWISYTGQLPKGGKRVRNQVELPEQVELWRAELTRLAEEFAAGRAAVNPKSYPKTCSYCAHRLLCRLDPATLLAEAAAEEQAPEETDG